jgi:hypothetical protein
MSDYAASDRYTEVNRLTVASVAIVVSWSSQAVPRDPTKRLLDPRELPILRVEAGEEHRGFGYGQRVSLPALGWVE